MAQIREIKPTYDGKQEASSYYFYTEYDPAEHFEYKIPFKKDGKNIDIEQLKKNKLDAYRKVVEHHFSFEQVFPKEDTDFIKLYKPIYNFTTPLDYNYPFDSKTQEEFETEVPSILSQLATRSEYVYIVARYGGMEKDFSEMSQSELDTLITNWNTYLQSHPNFIDATKWNKHCYDCALYCKIERPIALDGDGHKIPARDEQGHIIPDKYEYVSPYEFRKILQYVNTIYGFKIPIEEGWYKYDKFTRKWAYIDFLTEGDVNE